jgi:hypothetical protein
LGSGLLFFLLHGAAVRAQDVTGTVRVEAGRAPLTGAIVVLASPTGARLDATLTDDAGRFRLRATSSGTYSLRVDVIGYRSATVPLFRIDSGATVTRDILFPFERTQLPRIEVTATSSCTQLSGDAGDAPRLWAEARKTLEAARLAIDERRFSVALRHHERTISLPDSVLRASRTWTQTGVSQNPFETLPPETVARGGYSVTRDSARYYFAPDARILLSDEFVEAHCFGTRRGGSAGAVGLTFRPLRASTRVDIDGVLWLDSASAELRTLEYRYVPAVGRRDAGSGFVAFAKFPSGLWGVQRWAIRLPVLQVYESRRRPDGALGRFADTVVVAIRDVGGVVLTAGSGMPATHAPDTRLTGIVFDSTQAAPLANAHVTIEGFGRDTRTDSAGRFVFDSLADDGEVRLRVWHPRLDSLGLAAIMSTHRLRRRTESTAQLNVSGVAEVARTRCRGAGANTPRVIMGVVQSGADSTQPLPATEVVMLERRGAAADGKDSLVRYVEVASDVGRYAFCDVRPGAQAWLLVHSESNWSYPRYVSGEDSPPVEVVPLRMALTPDGAVADSNDPSPSTGAPALLLGRSAGSGSAPRVDGWVLFPENAAGPVQVLVDDVLRTTVAPDGSFALERIGVGTRRLTFRAPSLAIRHVSVNVQAGQSHLLLVTLRVAPVVIVQQEGAPPDQRLLEFRQRRRAGGGVFLDRAEIERRNPRTLTDLLRTVPGIRVSAGNGGFRFVSTHFRRLAQETGDAGACDMMMYVDGQPFPAGSGDTDSRIRVSEIGGVEVYVTAGSVPREFAGLTAACGVIVIWR